MRVSALARRETDRGKEGRDRESGGGGKRERKSGRVERGEGGKKKREREREREREEPWRACTWEARARRGTCVHKSQTSAKPSLDETLDETGTKPSTLHPTLYTLNPKQGEARVCTNKRQEEFWRNGGLLYISAFLSQQV